MAVERSGAPCVRAVAHGRTELAGNHTDHQGGRVIAATVDCAVEVVACANGLARACVDCGGFGQVDIDVSDTDSREVERNTTAGLVRGIVAGLRDAGVPVAGFDAEVASSVPAGSGLSSSAAFEMALARALELLFAGGEEGAAFAAMPPVQIARIGQAAERDWFGKPCGLMDQLAVATGGVNLFDFGADEPSCERLPFDFEECGLMLFLVDTRCDHSAYTGEYAQVPADMQAVARSLGVQRLRDIAADDFVARFAQIRQELGDLPALRGLHFYNEMRLVDARADALRAGDMRGFLDATRRSGASSAQYLQNVSVAGRPDQPAMMALALADILAGVHGAVRIHGGGFGGTVQAFVLRHDAPAFVREIDRLLGPDSCRRYRIAGKGAHAEWAC